MRPLYAAPQSDAGLDTTEQRSVLEIRGLDLEPGA